MKRIRLRDDGERLSGSRENKARCLCRFMKWLRIEKNINLSPLELLNYHSKMRKSERIEDRRWLVNLVLEHTRDNPDFEEYADRRKYEIFQSIKNFCDFHEVVLTTAKNIFGKKIPKKNHLRQVGLREVKDFLVRLNQRERTICMLQLHSGMELGAVLHKFSYMWHSQVKPQLDNGCERMKIEFDERKANGKWYFTYISRDAIHELKKWLVERKKIVETLLNKGEELDETIIEGEPIFITSRGHPLREGQYSDTIKRKSGGKITSHMFRKLFECEAKVPDRGIALEYVKFFMGHVPQMDEAGGIYDRNMEIREEIFEKEYEKLELYLNIFSGSVEIHRTDLEKKVNDLEEQLRAVSWLADPEKAERIMKGLRLLEELEHLKRIGKLRDIVPQ